MKSKPIDSGLPRGIVKLSEIDIDDEAGRNTALARILETREVRQAIAAMLPDLLNVIAGDSRAKKFIMKVVGRYIGKSLKRPADVFEKKELPQLFGNEKFISNIAEPLPDMINGLFDLITAAVGTIEGLGTEEKKELFGELLLKTATGQTGTLVTQWCRIVNDIHAEDPEFFARSLAPGFKKWIEALDFGELKEMVDNSASDARAFAEMINDVLWEYPAKVVLLLSLLPSVLNGVLAASEISLKRLNDLPPDLLTDVICAYLTEIDGRSIAGLLNQITELIRKVHTGSALLGEPGSPRLPKLILQEIAEISDGVEPVTLWKAKIALAELSASIEKAMAEAVNNHPALRNLSMIKGPEIANIRMKTANHKLSWWEGIDDEELGKSFARHLTVYDMQEMAEVANNLLRIMNRLGEQKPDLYAQLAGQFADAIDTDELAEAGRRLLDHPGESLRPLARSVVPNLVTWICSVIAPADDEHEDDAARAREAIRALGVVKEM